MLHDILHNVVLHPRVNKQPFGCIPKFSRVALLHIRFIISLTFEAPAAGDDDNFSICFCLFQTMKKVVTPKFNPNKVLILLGSAASQDPAPLLNEMPILNDSRTWNKDFALVTSIEGEFNSHGWYQE